MTDLPEKDEIVERVQGALIRDQFRSDIMPSETALDALTVPDLLALLRERGAHLETTMQHPTRQGWRVYVSWEKNPDD